MSSFVIGSLYIPDYHGIAWSQPGGVGSAVLPGPNDGSFGYPGNQLRMQESGSGLWVSSCQHWLDAWQIFRDVDNNGQSVAIIACPVCSNIQRVISPYEAIYDTIQYPIIIG